MSLGGKYVFGTVVSLVLPMCNLISCSSVLCEFCFLYCDDVRFGAVYEGF